MDPKSGDRFWDPSDALLLKQRIVLRARCARPAAPMLAGKAGRRRSGQHIKTSLYVDCFRRGPLVQSAQSPEDFGSQP
jgi:hypothetical protein